MKILKQIAIIFTICLIGEGASYALPFPIPASITSMLILLLALFTGVLKIDHIKEKSDFLLATMAFFFIPSCVGVLEHYETIKAIWLPFILICLVSTIIVFFVTGVVVTLVMKLEKRRKAE